MPNSVPNPFSLTDRVALVTGGTTGLGMPIFTAVPVAIVVEYTMSNPNPSQNKEIRDEQDKRN